MGRVGGGLCRETYSANRLEAEFARAPKPIGVCGGLRTIVRRRLYYGKHGRGVLTRAGRNTLVILAATHFAACAAPHRQELPVEFFVTLLACACVAWAVPTYFLIRGRYVVAALTGAPLNLMLNLLGGVMLITYGDTCGERLATGPCWSLASMTFREFAASAIVVLARLFGVGLVGNAIIQWLRERRSR